jgi:hypothetical protein
LRAYKYGGIGLVTAYIGLTQPAWFKAAGFFDTGHNQTKDENGKPMEADTMQIGGHEVPRLLAHSPMAAAIQFWATVRNGWQAAGKADKLTQAATAAGKGGAAMVGQLPGLENTASVVEAAAGKDRSAGKTLGNYVGGMALPGVSQQAAELMDPAKPQDPVWQRFNQPRMGAVAREEKTVGQTLKGKVPGLRQQVPTKKPAGAGRASADPMRAIDNLMKMK